MRHLLASQRKNTERYRLVRKALVINLANIHDLSVGTIANELQVSVQTVRQILKASKDEVHMSKLIRDFEEKALKENQVARSIKSILENSKRPLHVKDVRQILSNKKKITLSNSTVRKKI